MPTPKIPIAISSCLLGQSVRFNGGHKRSAFCVDILADAFEFTPYCPEVAIGMGIPRPSIRLVGDWQQPRALGSVDASLDVTDALIQYGQTLAPQCQHYSGYILMKDSPSCGLFSTKVYTQKGVHPGKRAGLFAQVIQQQNPLLPMEEEARLNDAPLRENFIARVFAYHQWRTEVLPQPSAAVIVNFHSRYKYFVMAHSQTLYKHLGALVAGAGLMDVQQLLNAYSHAFFTGIVRPPSKKNHSNVLYHIFGYLKKHLNTPFKQDITSALENYRKGSVPLIVPITLLNHYLHTYGNSYIQNQFYLNPYPAHWGLRNTI